MEIVDLRLVNNYINGEDKEVGVEMDQKVLDKLENDLDFMMCVINKSGDHRLYYHCSDDIKTNYTFVRFFINKFKTNVKMIDKVAKFFIDHSRDKVSKFELCIVMVNLTSDYQKICCDYGAKVVSKCLIDEAHVSELIKNTQDPKIKESYGLGFTNLFDMYEGNNIIIDFYAERKILEIYDNHFSEMQMELHEQFKTANDVRKYGINRYLIDFVAKYDNLLSTYAQTREYLLKVLRNGMQFILCNWDTYSYELELLQYHQVVQVYNEYSDKIKYNKTVNYYDLLEHIAKELGIKDEILNFIDDLYDEDNYGQYPHIYTNKSIESLIQNHESYQKLLDTIYRILSERNPDLIKKIHVPSDSCKVTRIRGAQ